MATVINKETPKEVLQSIKCGDEITNEEGFTGIVIALYKGENYGYMHYDFNIINGLELFSHYSFNKRPL